MNGATHASPLQRLILEKTEGNPFFIEEIVQALVEQGVLSDSRRVGTAHLGAGLRRVGTAHLNVGATGRSPLPTDLRIPTTVQGVLASRIDRLPLLEKELLQTLSVIGKEFSFSLLRQVMNQSEDALHPLLSHLQEAEFIYEQPAFPEPEYTFKHALTQEVAYNSLLIERRKILHEQTGQALEALFHSRLEDHYSDLARHYSRSGNTNKAVEYLQLAGQQAAQRSANAEAISHLTTALELLMTQPDTPVRARQELTLQIALGAPFSATKGWAASEVGAVYIRARELCQQMGETPQLFPALWGLWSFYVGQAEYKTAYELAEPLLTLAQHAQDPALLLEAYHALWVTSLYRGELVPARAYVEQGIALYNPQQHHSLAFLYGGDDPGVCCLSQGPIALWSLGYPDQALKRMHEALSLAHELAHPFSLAATLSFAAVFHQLCREGRATQERAETLITLSTYHGLAPVSGVQGTVLRGWALAEQGQAEAGVAQIRQGLAAYRATGAEAARPYYLALLAEVYGKVGQVEEGLNALAEALAMVDKTEERYYEAELYRLKGELSLKSRQVKASQDKSEVTSPQAEAEAEACFHKAIDIARRQQAKSLELRAVMSLSRLWQQQGKKEEARQMLAEIYGWFTEGFDTADLKEAKALLEELK